MLHVSIKRKKNKTGKVAKNLPKRSPTAIAAFYLIMLHVHRNVYKKFQPSIFNRSRENTFLPERFMQISL